MWRRKIEKQKLCGAAHKDNVLNRDWLFGRKDYLLLIFYYFWYHHLDTPHCYEYARYAEPPPGCVPAPHNVPHLIPPHNPDFIATIQSAGTSRNRVPSDNLQAAHFYGRYEQPLPPIFDGSRSMYGTNGSSQSNYSIPKPIDDGKCIGRR